MTAAAPAPPRVPLAVPDWHDLSACRLFPELDFIAAKPGSPAEHAARIICAACPVRLQCATGALERRERWGVWGGLTYADRKVVAARFGYEQPGDPPEHGTNSRYAKWSCRCHACAAAHAAYEWERRRGLKRLERQRRLWAAAPVITRPCRVGRRRVGAGQLVIPLPGLPAPKHATTLAA